MTLPSESGLVKHGQGHPEGLRVSKSNRHDARLGKYKFHDQPGSGPELAFQYVNIYLMNTPSPSDLTDAQLIARVARLSGCERRVTAALIAHLAEFERRSLHLGAGFPSLFLYCTEVLRLSEHEAYNRIEAARAGRRFPVILERLAAGCLNLTAVRLLAPHLTDANVTVLIAEAEGKGKRGVEEVLARYFPKPDVRDSIRKIAARPAGSASPDAAPAEREDGTGPVSVSAGPVPESALVEGSKDESATEGSRVESARLEDGGSANPPTLFAPTSRPDVLRPLAEDRYEVRFTATRETCEKLKLAKDLLRHRLPNGETAEVIDRALTVLLEDLARKKFAATSRPRSTTSRAGSKDGGVVRPGSRHLPTHVKRTVWIRDGAQCGFVGHSGRRCPQRAFLEFHHVRPYAVGGQATAENIELRCRAHNAYEAKLYYGPGVREGAELVPERVGPDGHASPSVAPTDGAETLW